MEATGCWKEERGGWREKEREREVSRSKRREEARLVLVHFDREG